MANIVFSNCSIQNYNHYYHYHYYSGMENARQRVNQTTVEIMRASRVQAGSVPGQYGMPQVWYMVLVVVVVVHVCVYACRHVCILFLV